MTKLTIQYYALLRDQRGVAAETIDTSATNVAELYETLAPRHGFTLARTQLKVAVNDAFVDWSASFAANDTVVFIPPVAGG